MKYLFSCITLLVILLVTSCNNKSKNQVTTKPVTNPNRVDTVPYFSFSGFFTGEINEVLSTPYFMYERTSINGKQDSVNITTATFNKLAQEFVTKDVSNPAIKGEYKEEIFNDLSTNSVTLNYSTLNKDLEIQGADVLIDNETNKIKRIFIRTIVTKGDSTVSTQYNWKAGKSFLINRSVSRENGNNSTAQYFVNWNDATK